MNMTRRPRRTVAAFALTLSVVLAGLAFAAPAQAATGFHDVCPGFSHKDSATIYGYNQRVIGTVMIGFNYENGRACVATIKAVAVGTRTYTTAGIHVYRVGDGALLRKAWDDGEYTHYAGDTCMLPPDQGNCSTVYARGGNIDFDGKMRDPMDGRIYVGGSSIPF